MGLLDWLKKRLAPEKTEEIEIGDGYRPKKKKNFCHYCKKDVGGAEKVRCEYCGDTYCYDCYENGIHSIHYGLKRGERHPPAVSEINVLQEVKKETSSKPRQPLNFGTCSECKKTITHVYDKNCCPYCMKNFCASHWKEWLHDCQPVASRGMADPEKKLDENLTIKEIDAIRIARDMLREYAESAVEIAGLLRYDGSLAYRVDVGNHSSVDPYFGSGNKGIFFHTHPNEDFAPSRADHRHAELVLNSSPKVKFIIVTKRGFSSYSKNTGHIIYGWHEI